MSPARAPALAPAAVAPVVPRRDAEAELNLPPGFRFHPTDEELVAYYLCARAVGRDLPVPIIAEVDLYSYDPWQLPPRALFGRREWYFLTPRGRKYPNGSRPNRSAGTGYWKATGADKPVEHRGRTLAIKKALVFYHGKPPRGVKTDWIMHEYRLADDEARRKKPGDDKLKLDNWVLCRLYHKKNEWERMLLQQEQQQAQSFGDSRTPESEIDDADQIVPPLPAFGHNNNAAPAVVVAMPQENGPEMDINTTTATNTNLGGNNNVDDWLLMGMNLNELQGLCPMPGDDFYSSIIMTPPPPPLSHAKPDQGAGNGAGAGFFY